MTREEAIGYLKRADTTIGQEVKTKMAEALDMAIKALEQDNCPYYVIDEDGHGLCKNHRLEQEPCEDVISRQAVIKAIYDNTDRLNIAQAIRELPSVNPQKNIVNNGTMNITL